MKRLAFFLGLSLGLHAGFEDLSSLNARGASLSGAVLTLGNDSSAIWVNPAQLARLSNSGLEASTRFAPSFLDLDSGSSYANLASTVRLKDLGLGFTVSGDFTTQVVNARNDPLFSDYRFAAATGFQTPIPWLSAGIAVYGRVVSPSKSAAGFETYNPTLDLNGTIGFHLAPMPYWSVAVVLDHLMPDVPGRALRQDNTLAPALRASFGTENPIVDGEASVEYLTREGTFAAALSVEKYLFDRYFRIGAGLRMFLTEGTVGPSFGLGLRIDKFRLDYALAAPPGSDALRLSHYLTLQWML